MRSDAVFWTLGLLVEAKTAEIVCFSTSQQISTMGDQLQVGMIYNDPVETLKDLGQSVSGLYDVHCINHTYLTQSHLHSHFVG
jgi:hypothetical protein